jgi:hypothetical protein
MGDCCIVLTAFEEAGGEVVQTPHRLSPIPEDSSRSESQISVPSSSRFELGSGTYFRNNDVEMDDHVII